MELLFPSFISENHRNFKDFTVKIKIGKFQSTFISDKKLTAYEHVYSDLKKIRNFLTRPCVCTKILSFFATSMNVSHVLITFIVLTIVIRIQK